MLRNYIKIAWKILSRKKLYTGVTLLGICFPLTIVTLIVSFTTHITSNSYPQNRFDKVVDIGRFSIRILNLDTKTDGSITYSGVPYKFYESYIKSFNTPEMLCFTNDYNTEVSGNNKNHRFRLRLSDANFWKIADYKLIEGKLYNNNDVKNANKYMVIDERTKLYFFGDVSPIGRNLSVNDDNYKVIGVVKNADITKLRTFGNVFIPVPILGNLNNNYMMSGSGNVLAFLGEKEDIKSLRNEMDSACAHFDLGQLGISDSKSVTVKVSEFGFASVIRESFRDLFNLNIEKKYILPVSILLLAFFFIVLPALNLIYINLSRMSERSEEVGVRKGFGGNRQTIFRQFIFENLLITLLGGVLALIVSFLVLFLINNSQLLPGCNIKFNALAYLISIVIWLLLGFLSGVLPAVRISKTPVISAIHGIKTKNSSYRYKWMKKENIWLSIELCCVFVALFSIINFFTFYGLNLRTPIGFNYRDIYEVKIYNPSKDFFDQDFPAQDKIFEWIRQNPLISESSVLKGSVPYGSTSSIRNIKYENKTISKDIVFYVELGFDDWEFWDFKLTEGDWINKNDTFSKICPVIINEKLRKELYGKEKAIGKQFERDKHKFEVKGVIESYKHKGELSADNFYMFCIKNKKYNMSMAHSSSRTTSGYVKFKNEDDVNTKVLHDQLKTKYPDYSFKISPLEKYRAEHLHKSLIPLLLILLLCVSVLLIVLFGMFGVIWYKINLRVPEIGLRKSTGATITRIFCEVISEAYLIALFGLLPGILIVIQFPLLGVLNFPLPVLILSIIISSLLIFIMVGLFTLLPAKKAAKIQPAMALHEE